MVKHESKPGNSVGHSLLIKSTQISTQIATQKQIKISPVNKVTPP